MHADVTGQSFQGKTFILKCHLDLFDVHSKTLIATTAPAHLSKNNLYVIVRLMKGDKNSVVEAGQGNSILFVNKIIS